MASEFPEERSNGEGTGEDEENEEGGGGKEEQIQEKDDPINFSTDAMYSSDEANSKNVSALIQQPQIFQLTIDCFDEIFEYFSAKKLHMVAQTCRVMQQIVGEYLRKNYCASENVIESDGISVVYKNADGSTNERMLTTVFNAFITSITYHDVFLKPLRFIESHCDEFKSLNHLCLVCTELRCSLAKHFEQILPKLKIIQFQNCTIVGDLYEIFLRFCTNLKRLYLQDAHLGEKWLQQSYPMLEHLELLPIPSLSNELDVFFEQNPTVTSFSTSAYSLWLNRDAFLKSKIKLDILEVKKYRYYTVVTNVRGGNNNGATNDGDDGDEDEDDGDYALTDSDDELDDDIFTTQSLCKLINQLYDRGFFKRLFIYMPDVNKKTSDYIITLRGLEKLCIKEFSESFSLPHLITLKELAIMDGANPCEMEILANNYLNLQYLFIQNATYDTLLPFIRRSVKLKRVLVFPKDKSHFNGNFLDLVQLNEERSKLQMAQKLVIYVPDNVFLKTKWKTNNGDTNLRLIQMKRSSSYEWNHYY